MREKHTGQDLRQIIIFTYRHQRDCLTDNKHQKGVDATVSQRIMLIGVTIRKISTLSEDVKKKANIFKSWDQTCYYEFQTQSNKQSKEDRTKSKWQN